MKADSDILSYSSENAPPELSQNALHMLGSRYLPKDGRGKLLETPDQMFERVAHTVSRAELNYGSNYDAAFWEEAFYHAMRSLFFLPNAPTLMHAGLPGGQLSACFVLPINEQLDAIFHTLKNATLIQQQGGGTGFNFSGVPPRQAHTQGFTGPSGVVSLIKMFDASTEFICQAEHRRRANMAVLNMDHPDIEDFLHCKEDESALRNFTISVGIQDAFMHALSRNDHWKLLHPLSRKVVKTVKARQLWEKLIHSAWKSGEPGIIFLDTLQRNNPLADLGAIHATNPCGEMPLMSHESSNLGSVNLARMLKYQYGVAQVDWDKLEAAVRLGIRFLDDVIDVNDYTLPAIKRVTLGNRKVGLGVMGWADLLIQLEVPYHSLEALQIARNIMRFVQRISFEASVRLGRQRGPFKNWRYSTYFSQRVFVRNATRNSIAPTKSLAMIANTSPSVEPLYTLAYKREHQLHDETMYEVSPQVVSYLKKHQLYSASVSEQIYRKGSIRGIRNLPAAAKKLLKTSTEIPFRYHLKHQQAFQKFTDNAVSKTINLPRNSRIEEIDKIYRMAWKLGLKGTTVYRDACRSRQVLSTLAPASDVHHYHQTSDS